MKTKITLILLCLVAFQAVGQSVADFEQRLYSTYVEEKIMDWESIISDMEESYLKENDEELLYSLCFAQYGYIGYCISKDLDGKAKEILKSAINNAKQLEAIHDGRHDVLALQGAFLGFKIILSKFNAMYLGPKAFKLINTAAESSDTYFNCSLEKGNMRYFTPKFLGGSKAEAIEYYENAVRIIEKSNKNEKKNWMYINTVLFLAHAYYETEAKDLACKQYQKILEYEPRVNWIRDEYSEKCQ